MDTVTGLLHGDHEQLKILGQGRLEVRCLLDGLIEALLVVAVQSQLGDVQDLPEILPLGVVKGFRHLLHDLRHVLGLPRGRRARHFRELFLELDGIPPEGLKHLEHHVRNGLRGLEVPGFRRACHGGQRLEEFEKTLSDFIGARLSSRLPGVFGCCADRSLPDLGCPLHRLLPGAELHLAPFLELRVVPYLFILVHNRYHSFDALVVRYRKQSCRVKAIA